MLYWRELGSQSGQYSINIGEKDVALIISARRSVRCDRTFGGRCFTFSNDNKGEKKKRRTVSRRDIARIRRSLDQFFIPSSRG